MSYSDLTPEILRELLTLVEKKETLLAEIATIDASITRLASADSQSQKTAPSPAPKVKAPTASKTTRAAKSSQASPEKQSGSLAERVAVALKDKPEGLSVPEIAKLTGAKPASLHVFFATTGKKKGFVKVGRGVWALGTTNEPIIPVIASEPTVESPTLAAEPAIEPVTEVAPSASAVPLVATVQPEFAAAH
ncbi:MAG TPA: hypothetical protein VIM61_04790 [Chthoniobacterales bacterium]